MKRLWPILVAGLFCLPLFINLDGVDLRGDEAAHSFAVDRILETGDWLIPRNSPSDNPFVEKPPLKFWIVAAPIRAGLLSQNEFGMRFWDALFGGLAFLYIYFIGARLAGPLCGFSAVLVLFIHLPLIFDHGIRTNNMEAALLLSYSGGIYHYLAWESARTRAWGHILAVGLLFTLGFMVKFVAALFLPLIIGVAALAMPSSRRRLLESWGAWTATAILSLALIAPWFIYGHLRFGRGFWHIILGEHVYVRLMTTGLDPTHVHPWNFYFLSLYENLLYSGGLLLVGLGAILLLVDTVRRPTSDRMAVLLWFVLPFGILSAGTSKLYHYAYPFLPPAALAGGYVIGACWDRLQPIVARRTSESTQSQTWFSKVPVPLPPEWRRTRMVLNVLAGLAVVVLVWTALVGPIELTAGGTRLFKNGSIFRPWVAAVFCALLAGRAGQVGRYLLVPVLILWMLPIPSYRDALTRLQADEHPYEDARNCILDVRGGDAATHSIYVAGPDSGFLHNHTYYFRKLGTIERAIDASPERLTQYLTNPTPEPVLVDAAWYRSRDWPAFDGVTTERLDNALLLLPGAYARCAAPVPVSQR